jgi:hypothetical protein
MPVRDGADHLLPNELGPQGGALRGTGRAKTSLLAGKGDEPAAQAENCLNAFLELLA